MGTLMCGEAMRSFFEKKDAGMGVQRKICLRRRPEGNLLGQRIHKLSACYPRATVQALCVSGNRWEVFLRVRLTDSTECECGCVAA